MAAETLKELREKMVAFRDGTKQRFVSDDERIEVEAIHKTLNVVLAEIDALLALGERQETAEPPLAVKYFESCRAEIDLDEALMRVMGATVDDDGTQPDTWPCRHIVYDPYDASFELWKVKVDDWQPTSEQLAAAFALGFAQCWICYPDGTERWYHRDGRSSARKPSVLTRDNDQKYLLAKALAAHREGPATAESSADPIPLSREQIKHIQTWADDTRLWNTREVALFNLFTFARLMMKSADGAHSVDDALDVYAPGAWRCPKCGFALQKQTIFIQTGSIGSSHEDVMNVTGEVCPNDGVMMSRETWHDRAEANYKWGVDLMEQVITLTGAASLPAAIDTIKSLSAHREGRPPAAEKSEEDDLSR